MHEMRKERTWRENMSRVLCPLWSIAAAINTALATFDGKISMAKDMQAPPRSCPTKMTCRDTNLPRHSSDSGYYEAEIGCSLILEGTSKK